MAWESPWQQVWWLTRPGWMVHPSLPTWVVKSSGYGTKVGSAEVHSSSWGMTASLCPSPLFLLTDLLSVPHRSVEPAVFFLSSRYDCGGQTQLFIAPLEQLAMTAREEERKTFKARKTASSWWEAFADPSHNFSYECMQLWHHVFNYRSSICCVIARVCSKKSVWFHFQVFDTLLMSWSATAGCRSVKNSFIASWPHCQKHLSTMFIHVKLVQL